MRRKIAQISTVHVRTDTRIAVKICQSLAQGLDADVALFVQDGLGSKTAEGPHGVSIIDTGAKARGRLARAFSGAWRMYRAVRRWRPDVVQFHDPELIWIGLLLRLSGIRVVYDVHEDVPRQILGKFYLSRPRARVISVVASVVEAIAARLVNRVVAATPVIAARFPAHKTITVCNYPKLSEFPSSVDTDPEKRLPHIAYVGGISEIRGGGEMIDALAKCRHPDVRLIFAGSFAPESYGDVLRARTGWDRVQFEGWADRGEVARILASVRCGIVIFQPTPNNCYGRPTKMFEYMASGLPVIASDFPVWREIVEGAGCGLLVDPQDPAAIAEAMDWILAHPDEAAAMGERGRRAVEEIYSWSNEAQKLLDLYRDVLGVPVKENGPAEGQLT